MFVVLTASVLLLIGESSAYAPLHTQRRSSRKLCMTDKMLRISVNVNDINKTKQFYENSFLGFTSHPMGSNSILVSSTASKFGVQLVQSGDVITQGNAYLGIGVKIPKAMDAIDSSFLLGSQVVTDFGDYAYGASEVPDEDEMKRLPVQYGRILDINGYVVEVAESAVSASDARVYKIVVGVLDLNDSIDFYTKVLKMKLLRRRSNVNSIPKSASMCAYCGYHDESSGPIVELYYQYATERVDVGSGLNEIVLGSSDLDFFRKQVESAGQVIVSEDGSSFTIKDPNGVKIRVERTHEPTPAL